MKRAIFPMIAIAMGIASACSSSDEGVRPPSGSGGRGGGAGGSTAAGGSTGGAESGGTGGSTGGASVGTGGSGGIIVGPGADSGLGPNDSGGCASSTIKAELLPANLLFVIDRSGSMNCNLPPITSSADCEAKPERVDSTQPSKWEIIRDALKSALAALPPTASAGISYFSNDDECGVQSAASVEVKPIDATQISALNASLDGVKPAGGTPIVGATILGYKHMHQQLDLPGNDFVVLLTDGSESCTPEDVPALLQTQVPNALLVGIRTFSIGVPGSEQARGFLSQIAYAGGHPVERDVRSLWHQRRRRLSLRHDDVARLRRRSAQSARHHHRQSADLHLRRPRGRRGAARRPQKGERQLHPRRRHPDPHPSRQHRRLRSGGGRLAIRRKRHENRSLRPELYQSEERPAGSHRHRARLHHRY
jgi:hypothetical protein